MTVLRLPGGTLADFVLSLGLIALCFLGLGLVIYLDVRRFRRSLKESDLGMKDALKHIPQLSPGTKLQTFRWLAIHVTLVIGLLVVLFILTSDFVAVGIGNSKLRLDYWVRSPVVLSWHEVRSVELYKKRVRSTWQIAVKTYSGREYRSIFTATYRELPEVQRIYDELVSARARLQATPDALVEGAGRQ